MSFEGYYQRICKNKHYYEVDALEESYSGQKVVCPKCEEDEEWSNLVNVTNGSFGEDGYGNEIRIDGYVNIQYKDGVQCTCKCGHVHWAEEPKAYPGKKAK